MMILVRGSGDVGSAVAHLLFTHGYSVLIHDSVQPAATRRKMSFCDAMYDGIAELEGIQAQYVPDLPGILDHLGLRDRILITAIEVKVLLAALKPDVLVDARMRKHDQPETQIELAPLTIGLGPNFVAGSTVHAAVETGWNENLGRVVRQGPARPLEGEPQMIAGHARDRYVYAPAAGVFQTTAQIGDAVSAGQHVATIGAVRLQAPISGLLRGLVHDGVPVREKAKVIEVDPRNDPAKIAGIAERPGLIAQGVLEAVLLYRPV